MHFDVPITGDSIKLGQFVKLANLAESGGMAKEAIAGGEVRVNGEVVTARGHKLIDGDRVQLGDSTATVSAGVEDDFFDEATANDDFDPEKWRNL
ncbi:RNA-binding S4 domain-containing protein [Corynebacterium sp. Marseille-P4321]|uniref:RNA-binding S4 domain-containing protein n=1 Tax=Corynebacterium sp. Marseille-P4321 TaxID=2736603 RepID=UPI00089332A0|nr:RNA-binding S4 domain-containing protein [Corynebacterium sp. Marseille-P4321]OEY07559.1 RNA-binding protein [Corynebacterium sp. BCW_4722]